MQSPDQTQLILFALPAGVASALLVVRFFYLVFLLKLNSTAFMGQILKLVEAGNEDRAVKLCNAVPSALLPKMTKLLIQDYRHEGDRAAFFAEASPLIAAATKRFVVLNVFSIMGIAGSFFLFSREGLLLHKAFLIPSGIALYLNFSTFFNAHMVATSSERQLNRLWDLIEERRPKEAARDERRSRRARAHQGEEGAPEDLQMVLAEEGPASPPPERVQAGSSPVVCTFCGASMELKPGWQGNLNQFNLDDWVTGPCPNCQSELFKLT